jgi:hypothetical protein
VRRVTDLAGRGCEEGGVGIRGGKGRRRRLAENEITRPAEDRRKNKKDEKLSQEKLED